MDFKSPGEFFSVIGEEIAYTETCEPGNPPAEGHFGGVTSNAYLGGVPSPWIKRTRPPTPKPAVPPQLDKEMKILLISQLEIEVSRKTSKRLR